MIPLDKYDLTILHILKNEKLIIKAIKAAKKDLELFSPRQRPHLDLIWRQLLKAVIEAKKEGKGFNWNKELFVANILEEMKTLDIADENKARIEHICVCYTSDKEYDLEQGDKLLLSVINEAIQKKISKAIYNSEEFDKIKSIVAQSVEIHDELQKGETQKILFVNPLKNVRRYLRKVPKLPTGVKHFDKVTNGGMSEEEIALIAGITGGGKSVSAIEIVGSQLLLGNNVAWFTYEQPFDQDLMQRMVAFITGYSLDNIRGTEYDALPEDVKATFESLSQEIDDNLTAADFSSGEMLDKDDPEDDTSCYSIRKRLEILKERGKIPTYIIVDWLGAAVKRIASIRGVDIGVITNYIALANEFITDLLQIAKDFKTRAIFFHQLDPVIKKSPPSRKPTTVELQMIKSATNWIHYGIAIGKRDSNHRCWYICDKCRNAYPSECVVELDGEHSRFKLLEGYVPGRNGQFINVDAILDEMNENREEVESSYQNVL